MRSSRVWMRSSRVWIRSSRVWMRSSRVWIRSSRGWMRSSRVWMRSSRVWMRSSRVVRASDSQCRSRNCPGFDPSILRHSGIWGAADEAVLNIVNKKLKNISLFKFTAKLTIIFGYELEMCWRVYVGVPLVHSVYSAASEGLKGKPISGPKLKKPPPSFLNTYTHHTENPRHFTHITQKTQDILHTSHRKPKTFYTGNRREVIGHVVFGL